jgi:hypothetical protein
VSKFVPLWQLLVCLSLLGLILIGECMEATPVASVSKSVVNGKDSSSEGSAPVYDYPTSAVITRDPANYMTHAVIITKNTHNPTTEKSSESDNLSSNESPNMQFNMSSYVQGTQETGKYLSVWSKLEGIDEDYKAHQSISASSGTLTQSRRISFSKHMQTGTELNYSRENIDIQDSIEFSGKDYNDISRFRNGDDLIQENIKASEINKDSRFNSQSLIVSVDNNETKTLSNNYTNYNIRTEFTGSSDLHAITNGTEIMQYYTGQIELSRKITNQFMANHSLLEDHWLPCCNVSDWYLG